MRNDGLIKSFYAEGTLEGRKLATFGAGKLVMKQATDATDALIGVTTQIGSETNGRVDVIFSGITEATAGGTIAKGTVLTSDANADVITATQAADRVIGIAYMNKEFISDRVLPRVAVPSREFKWTKYNTEDRFTIPDTLVGRKGQPNVVEFGGTEASAFVQDYGLEDHIPQQDLDNASNAGNNFDPRGTAVELLTEVIGLDREKRTATQYAKGHRNRGSDHHPEPGWPGIYQPDTGGLLMLSLKQAQKEIQNVMDTVMLHQQRKPLFNRIGRALVTDARMNFKGQHGPDGKPWAPLKIRTGRILTDTGRLRNSLSYKTGDDEVEIGTNLLYAPVHQFGATIRPRKAKMLAFPGSSSFKNGKTIFARQVTIPARPFLGLEKRQINKIHAVIDQWIKDVANRNV